MHIQEGVLPPSVLAVGAGVAACGVAIGLARTKEDDMVKVAVMSSAFFVASLIQVPFGPTSVHLVLNGLMGVILGWAALPAIAVALALQFLLFSHGGLTTIGVNTIVMGAPALACYFLYNNAIQSCPPGRAFLLGALAGFTSLGCSAILLASTLLTVGSDFATVAGATLVGHIPIFVVEGIVTGAAVSFLRRVRPETFAVVTRLRPATQPAG